MKYSSIISIYHYKQICFYNKFLIRQNRGKRNLERVSMPSRSFASASNAFNGLNLLITFQKIEKYLLLLLAQGKKQSQTIPITSSACGLEIKKNGLNSLSSFDAAKGIYDSIYQKKSAIMIYSSNISVYQYKQICFYNKFLIRQTRGKRNP